MSSEWYDETQNKVKLRTYIKFKERFEPEEYLLHYMSKNKRSLIAQIRCGILPIFIETGRFKTKMDDKGKQSQY